MINAAAILIASTSGAELLVMPTKNTQTWGS